MAARLGFPTVAASLASARAEAFGALRVRVPAKVNLFLRVRGRRPDGYHRIETVFHTIGLWDEVAIAPSRLLRFRRSGLPSPAGADNLCVRALVALRDLVRPRSGADVRLRKRIPSGAGLGGGSGDAAAVLAGLNRFWRAGLTISRLRTLALSLGSDVPFFLAGGAAVGRGRGERLSPLPSRLRAWAVVLKPRFGVSTRAAYAALDRMAERNRGCPGATLAGVSRALRRGRLDELRTHNDFEAALATPHPDLARLRTELLRAGAAPVFLTGSGSALIGLCADRRRAGRVARALGCPRGGFLAVVPVAPYRMKISRTSG